MVLILVRTLTLLCNFFPLTLSKDIIKRAGLRTAAHQKGFLLFFLCFTAFVIFTFSMCVVVVAAVPVSGEKICLT